jgi:hypothetical protein
MPASAKWVVAPGKAVAEMETGAALVLLAVAVIVSAPAWRGSVKTAEATPVSSVTGALGSSRVPGALAVRSMRTPGATLPCPSARRSAMGCGNVVATTPVWFAPPIAVRSAGKPATTITPRRV